MTSPDTAQTPSSASQDSTRVALRTAAPLITMGATWAARKGMTKAYEARTGKPAPGIHSREAFVATKVLWAAAIAGIVALIDIAIWQLLDDEE